MSYLWSTKNNNAYEQVIKTKLEKQKYMKYKSIGTKSYFSFYEFYH